MMLTLKYILLAVLQGITEFLPVSSSGHLVLFGAIAGFTGEENVSLGILLHAGSLFAIVAFYFQVLVGFFKRDQLKLLLMVIAGSVPAGIAGVAIKLSGLDDTLFGNPIAVALAFWVTATLLRMTSKPKLAAKCEPVELKNISLKQALIVGFVQAFAILPGISRSGSTIASGVLCGIKREDAATFSFLLATPAICGAILLEILKAYKGAITVQGDWVALAAAVVVSAAVSYISLKFLVNIVKRGKLVWFSWYLYFAGAAVMLLAFKGFFR